MGIIGSRAIAKLLATLAVFVCTFSHAAIPPSERAVLDTFYQQTGGPNWTNNGGWGGDAGSECTWFGVVCTLSGNNVTMINVPNNNLVGTLPAISALTQLQQLSVGSNKLTGTLPSLTGLTQFTSLFAGANQFSGSIPSLSGLSNLRDFYVYQNLLTGSIPALTGLTNLQYVYVNNNQLSGNLPSLAGLTGLIEFRAQFNQLSGGIPPLTGLSNLQIYGVGSNQLTGTLPSLAGLANLQVFNAYTNRLTGTIPLLSGLTNLQQINVSSNNLSGNIPAVAGLVNLKFLVFDENQLTGSIPALDGLTNLAQFSAANNQLTGSIPNLSSLVNLDTFYAYNNQLIGSIPALAGLSNLADLQIDGNHLTGSIPALTGLSKLTKVFAGGNQLTGSIPSLAGLGNLATFLVQDNQLAGGIPSLTGLAHLQVFGVFDNQLTGTIPPLTGLANLQIFYANNNQLTGPIPPLDGLSNLSIFGVAGNRLTGSIPSLTNLPALQYFQVGDNGLTGDVPTAPATLLAVPSSLDLGQSSLCNNALNKKTDSGWDAATGIIPWYLGCTSVASTLTITTADIMVATGTSTTITATIVTSASAAATAKALIADVAGANMGTVTVTDDQGKLICYIVIVNNTGSCNVVLPGGTTTNLISGYSGATNIAPASASISKATPIAVPGNLDQHGWTGAWYNLATGGQGIVFEIYPDLNAVGDGAFGGGWFTYDTSSGGEDKKRWYTLQGHAYSNSPATTLDIIAPTGGNFNAGPIINSGNGQNYVGHATLSFTDCTHGSLSYSFTDGSSRVGNIPLIRGDANVTCAATNGNGNGVTPGTFLLSGAWYSPSTSGQGILFDINPVQNILFAAWYTYAPNGQAIGGGASQRWYSLQIASAAVGTTTLGNIDIYAPQGGVFDTAGGVTTPKVGSASMVFNTCNAMTLTYAFTSGTNSGQNGTINLQRVGPTPAGCNL